MSPALSVPGWLQGPPELPPPLELDWNPKPLSSARTSLAYRKNGVLELTIDHDTVRGVTPEMLLWWFRGVHLDMTLDGRTLPRYRVWHPSDHIALSKPSLAPDGSTGEGASFRIVEVFGRDPRFRVEEVGNFERFLPSLYRAEKI